MDPLEALNKVLDDLTDGLGHDEPDAFEVIEHLQPVMAPVLFKQLCESREICPIHICDIQICRDDELECQLND